MSEFIPFAAFASATGEGAATKSEASPASQPFVPIPTLSPAPPPTEARPAQGHQPTVKFQREGDTIRRVQIHCSCGQVIELDCVY